MVNQAKLDQMLSNLGAFIEALRKLSLLSRISTHSERKLPR